MRALILNDDDKQCAVGEQGELCISGTGISLGYWNSPEITAKAFVQNPLIQNITTEFTSQFNLAVLSAYENYIAFFIFINKVNFA